MPNIASKLTKLLTDAGTPERCGFVMANKSVIEVENTHEEPEKGFIISPYELIQHQHAIGTWHTHPGQDPNLSEADYQGFCQWPGWEHWIVGIRDGKPLALCFTVEAGMVLLA